MHDEFVEEYTVSLSGEKVTIKTRNSNGDGHIATFENVLTHMFNCVIGGSQLLEINENSIECFMEENRAILAEKRDFCWPIDYQTEDELRLFLEKNGYKYYVVYSSYGLNGWVLAKKWFVEVN